MSFKIAVICYIYENLHISDYLRAILTKRQAIDTMRTSQTQQFFFHIHLVVWIEF